MGVKVEPDQPARLQLQDFQECWFDLAFGDPL
jgi:hypothetical protein